MARLSDVDDEDRIVFGFVPQSAPLLDVDDDSWRPRPRRSTQAHTQLDDERRICWATSAHAGWVSHHGLQCARLGTGLSFFY